MRRPAPDTTMPNRPHLPRFPCIRVLLYLCCAALPFGVLACRSGGTMAAGGVHAHALRGRAAPHAHPFVESPIDVEHIALTLDLVPRERAIHGVEQIRLNAVRDHLAQIELDLEELTVERVTDREGHRLAFARAPGKLVITPAHALRKGESFECTIEYGGRPRKGLWFVAERDGVPTQVFTQGECEDARWWFACADHPSDRITSELVVGMPRSWSATAAGERVERREEGERAVERWRMHVPHPSYLVSLSAGEFAVKQGSFEGTPLSYLAGPQYGPLLEPCFTDTPRVLAVLGEITGRRYPYAKYSQACLASFPFGGMENISATTLTETVLSDERGLRDSPMTDLICHEAAHQWFGDLLTCRDWSHIWLNEGFATYLTLLYKERTQGVDEFRAALRDTQDSYISADVGKYRRPTVWDVYSEPMDLFFTGQTYAGGAVRLQLLRGMLGDSAFFRGLAAYVGLNAGRSVVTDDLRHAFEQASGKDLASFFDQWFLKRGYPEFEVSWKWDAKRKLVLLSVNQTQDVADGTPACFRVPLEVGVCDAHGVRLERFTIERRRHLFEFKQDEAPRWVRFDPAAWIPKKLDERKQDAEWADIAANDEDVNGRRDALAVLGRLLQKGSTDVSREKLLDVILGRLAQDKSRAVRVAASSALSSAREPAVREALAAAATGDTDARVRGTALNVLAGFGPSPELAALALRVWDAGWSWNTMGAAAALYRSAAPEHAAEWLTMVLATPSPNDVLRARLIGELASLRKRALLPDLRKIALDEHESDGARAAAIAALGQHGTNDSSVQMVLIPLLEARPWRVRGAAIAALGALHEAKALDALADYYPTSPQVLERRAIEAIIDAQAERE